MSAPDMTAYPANETDVTTREIVIGGERIRLVESGPPGGFPIVLLHGWGASAYNYRYVLPALAQAGLHAIAPDLRGHGWSATQFPSGAWSSENMADWVMRLLDALGVERCVLVGQSIGGAIAIDAATLLPGRVVALVLLAPIGFTSLRRVTLVRALGLSRLHPRAPRWAVSLVMRRIYGTRTRWTDRDVDEYWAPLRRRAVVGSLLQSVREFDFTPRDPRSVHLGECRLLIRFGELDRLIPHQDAVAHARGFRGADVAVLNGVGHVPAEEVPDEIAALIQRVASETT